MMDPLPTNQHVQESVIKEIPVTGVRDKQKNTNKNSDSETINSTEDFYPPMQRMTEDGSADNLSGTIGAGGEDIGGYRQVERQEAGDDELKIRGSMKPCGSSPESFLHCSDDEEESDDELLNTPSALEEVSGWPMAVTPTQVDSGLNSLATTSTDIFAVKDQSAEKWKSGHTSKLTLDVLLADHEEKVDLVREMDDINRQLQEDLKQGGFANILNKHDTSFTDSQITQEQHVVLQHLEVHETRIRDVRPGQLVFQPQMYGQLFNTLVHPTHCGFTADSNGLSLEKHIQSITPDQYKLLITSGIITHCFMKIQCKSPVLRWLFFIMSVHSDYQVQQGCKKTVSEILHFQQLSGARKWTPHLSDVLSVFVNYGASLEKLMCCSASTSELFRGKLLQQPNYAQPDNARQIEYRTENLLLVLQILAQALHGQSGRYNPEELNWLCVVLCKASLDTALKHGCADGSFQNAVAMAIKHYTDAAWLKERLNLIRKLMCVATHHHDCAHIAQLLPPGVRGTYVQRRYCYLVLSKMLLENAHVTDAELENFEIKDLEKFVAFIKHLLETDSYQLSSVTTLLDLSVGVNFFLKSTQREQLKCLLEHVRRVRVKDNVSFLDRTRVKDSIVRMTSKWALDIQAMKGKQTKIFEYASPVKMHIETIRSLQTGDSESDTELPPKVQKLSPSTEDWS